MADAADIAGRRAALLGELAELGMSLARRVHGEAMAAAEPEALVALSNGFQRVARVVRQSLALQARMERDLERAARDAIRFAEAREAERVARRQALLKIRLERAIWTEAEEGPTPGGEGVETTRDADGRERDRADEALDIYDPQIRVEAMHDLLEEFALCEGFADVDLAEQVRWMRGQIGMAPQPSGPPNTALRPIPRPQPPPPPAPPRPPEARRRRCPAEIAGPPQHLLRPQRNHVT
jgi:hypothetical protein